MAHPLVHRGLERLVRPFVRRVLHDLARREIGGQSRRDAECRQVLVVCGSANTIRTHVDHGERHRVGARRAERLERARLVFHAVVHEPDARADAFGELLLDVERRLMRQRLLDVRVDRDRTGQRARGERAFFTWLVNLVAGDAAVAHLVVEPLVGQALDRLVGVGVRPQAHTRVEAIHPVVDLQDGLAGAHEIVGHAQARHDRVPLDVVLLGERARRDLHTARERVAELRLIRSEDVVMIVADAEVQRGAADRPLVGDEEVGGVDLRNAQQVAVRTVAQFADAERGRRVHLYLRRVAAARDGLADITRCDLQVSLPARLLQELAAHLEVVRAAPPVLEVRQ